MNKFKIWKLLRDDGETFVIDEKEIYLAQDNSILAMPEIDTSEVEYTEVDGGEMIGQRLHPLIQTINGIMLPNTEGAYLELVTKLINFFKINHTYTILYRTKTGKLFTRRDAWISDNLQLNPVANEDYLTFTCSFKVPRRFMYEYADDGNGNEMYSNSVTLPLLTAASGGCVWDAVGSVYDNVGAVYEEGNGGVKNIIVNSKVRIYPVWNVKGPCNNPQLQNNTTDTIARYSGFIASGQKLVVNFETNEARIDRLLVSRSVTGQIYLDPGINTVGFNSEGGDTKESMIEWRNIY